VLLAANTSSSKALFDVGVEMGGSLQTAFTILVYNFS